MKLELFKKLIKESVREVIQEELKDILLEALKSNKSQITETKSNPSTIQQPQKLLDKKKAYMDILNETAEVSNTSPYSKPFNPVGGGDTISEGSSLPDGELDMSQIMGLLKK